MRISARPTTTGDTASGRSISAPSSRLPGNRCRTSRIAAPTPNTVLASTAQNATLSVTSIACTADGPPSALTTGPRPCANVRQAISPTGKTSRSNRYPRASTRSGNLATAGRPALYQVQRDEDDERDHEQRGGHRRGRRDLVV